MMTNKDNQNNLWTEEDTMECLAYLHEARIEREVNTEECDFIQEWSFVWPADYDAFEVIHSVEENNDGTYTHVFSGMNEYCEPEKDTHPTRLFKLPLPFLNKVLQVVFTLVNKD